MKKIILGMAFLTSFMLTACSDYAKEIGDAHDDFVALHQGVDDVVGETGKESGCFC